MRKNTQEVMNAWEDQRALGGPGDSIWTDGTSIFSYDTCIMTPAYHMLNGPPYILNMTKYSHTTTTHQNSVASRIMYSPYRITDSANRGETAAGLRERLGF